MIEPSSAEQALWSDVTRDYVSDLQAELSRATSNNKIAVEALEKIRELNKQEWSKKDIENIAKQSLDRLAEEDR